MANYDTVKAAIEARLNALGYMKSSQAVNFDDASANEYGNRFILKPLTGQIQTNTIIDRFDDEQEWQILIAFVRSKHNDVAMLDTAHRGKDAIIKDLDKPANWSGSVKILKYDKWEVIETPNYFVLDIRLAIVDEYIHG